ncbi:MAG: STAS domain-containing protein [Planctomycetes bacterium]|nr:STAS domain-containing protein [Planctomycetota bacterium]
MLETKKMDNTVSVYPEGKITAANVDEFRKGLLELVESGAVDITINLNQVDIIDSKGLSVFIVCHKTVNEKGGSLTVVTDNADFQNLFHVMRLDEHFKIKESE